MQLACICPNPAIDHTVIVPGFATGETLRAIASATTAGGKGLNVARFAQGFGARAVPVTWLGEVGADHVRALARRDGMYLQATVVSGAAVRVCPVLVDSGTGSVLATSDPPAVLDPADWSAFTALAASVAAEADIVCISGSFPRVDGIQAVDRLLDAVGSTVPVWVDTSGSALARVAVRFPSVGLKVNLVEARALLAGGRNDRRHDRREPPRASLKTEALEAAETLSRWVRPVIVTAGAAGAAEATPAGVRWQDAPVVKAKNPTASGDAFMAAYVCAGRGQLSTLSDPLRAAVLAGAANACSWAPSVSPEFLLRLAGHGR